MHNEVYRQFDEICGCRKAGDAVQSFQEVFVADIEVVEVPTPPRIIGSATKP